MAEDSRLSVSVGGSGGVPPVLFFSFFCLYHLISQRLHSQIQEHMQRQIDGPGAGRRKRHAFNWSK